MGHFAHQEILRLASMATEAGLNDQRRALFSGVDSRWPSSVQTAPTPAAQTLQDLTEINEAPGTDEREPPMAYWLANAAHLSRSRPDARIEFQTAMQKAFPNFEPPRPLPDGEAPRTLTAPGVTALILVMGAALGVWRLATSPATVETAPAASTFNAEPVTPTATAILAPSGSARPASPVSSEPPQKHSLPGLTPTASTAPSQCIVSVVSAPPSWWLRCTCAGQDSRPPSLAMSLSSDPGTTDERRTLLLQKAAARGWTCP